MTLLLIVLVIIIDLATFGLLDPPPAPNLAPAQDVQESSKIRNDH